MRMAFALALAGIGCAHMRMEPSDTNVAVVVGSDGGCAQFLVWVSAPDIVLLPCHSVSSMVRDACRSGEAVVVQVDGLVSRVVEKRDEVMYSSARLLGHADVCLDSDFTSGDATVVSIPIYGPRIGADYHLLDQVSVTVHADGLDASVFQSSCALP